MHSVLLHVTDRIRQRSAASRSDYLQRLQHLAERPVGSQRLGCANLAHVTAGLPVDDRLRIVSERAPHIGVVTAYNDMLSAHRPYEDYPHLLRASAHAAGATMQVAGGVPAMCDGVTQGLAGMEMSLFSRDVIAQGTAIALSHDVFDGALLLGICDKIVPGLLIGALHFGHLPCIFIPAGPMSTGLSNAEKAKMREKFATGAATREELYESESKSYHEPGTCTFYGTANSNQMLLEAMGLHLPGAAFIHPSTPLREALTIEAPRVLAERITAHRRAAAQHDAAGATAWSIGRIVDERCIVNAMVALLATGGSTNHLIHWVAVARAAGILIDWNDFSELSDVVPLLARVYPNGEADVNAFQAAGGPGWILRELVEAGLMHGDAGTCTGSSLREHARLPVLDAEGNLAWKNLPAESSDTKVLRPAADPFSPIGGLRVLGGNLGRSVIKVSSVPEDRWVIEAPARVFDDQSDLLHAFEAGELERDFVAVVRYQGPRANGMPELHKLTPPLGVLQGRGFRVALVTDGRMSGASGKVPAAIHLCPEAVDGGPLARVRDGDLIRLDAHAGTLQALVPDAEWARRETAERPEGLKFEHSRGLGRDLFAGFRRNVNTAEEGACTWL
ncbi:MAG: phosphogluconate dehydratase [Aquabacterium sp.]|nr:MAG: phosphogluconate dehydratase [Aquabacterium sp.]